MDLLKKAGILAGDKIVSIDNKPFVGDSVTNEEHNIDLKDLRILK